MQKLRRGITSGNRSVLDKFTHLYRFQAIVEEGSLRRAAERLNLTQPALSRSLAMLEQDFGRPLLERHARGVRPTAFGERVLTTARRMMRQWDIADSELRSDPAEQRVALRLGLGPIWRSGVLAPVFEAMRRRHPNLLIEISALREASVLQELAEGRLDAALGGTRIDRREHPHLVRHNLTDIHVQITAREGHPVFERLSDGDVASERCLIEYPWLLYTEMLLYTDDTDYTFSDRYGREPNIWLKSSNLLTILTTLQRSDSLCVLSDLTVSEMREPRLLPLPVDLRRRHIPLGLIHREELDDWDLLTEFRELCAQRFAGLRPPEA